MIFAPPTGNSNDQLAAWAKRLVDDINRFHPTPDTWPIFANDAAAANGNLKVGQPYRTPDGTFRWRVV